MDFNYAFQLTMLAIATFCFTAAGLLTGIPG